jgi:hypothetical protein
MCLFMANRGGQYSDLGDRFFDEFNTRFWLRPGNNLKVASNLVFNIFKFIIFLFLDSAVQRVHRTNAEVGTRRGRRNQ